MKLEFDQDHELLRQTARRLLADKCPMSEIRRFAEDADAHCHEPLLRAVADSGWLSLLIAEEYDGGGLDLRSLAVLLEEAGRRLLPAPLINTALAAVAIAKAGSPEQRRRWLPELASGALVATVAFTEPGGAWDPTPVTTTAHPRAQGHVLSGVKNHVLWGQRADLLLSPATLESGAVGLFVIDMRTDGVRVQPERGIDPTRPMARVSLASAAVADDQHLAAATLDDWRALHTRGYALLAAEMIGAAQAALTMTRDYANERVQFGRPIGSFQAVKHPLVDVIDRPGAGAQSQRRGPHRARHRRRLGQLSGPHGESGCR